MRLSTVITIAIYTFFLGLAYAEVRIQPAEAMKFATAKIQPEYSPIAKQMKVYGRADVEIVINSDGTIESVKAISGNPLLTASAVAAVKKWKFNPIMFDGTAVKAVTTLSFDFK
jgi:TonB family protein